MLGMLIAYDADGDVVATLDYMVAKDAQGDAVGLIDFGAHEDAGGELTAVWTVESAVGSKVWPEWLGARAHDFRVERDGPPGRRRITALVHRASGHRRERASIEAAIAECIRAAGAAPADVRDVVGGPDRPLLVDDEGRTIGRSPRGGTPASLPVATAAERRGSHPRG